MQNFPLSNVTVLDLGQIYNGPYAGFLMAQAGARVIKLEPTGDGETLRARGLASAPAYAFAMLNSNKEGITLNLKHARGKAMLKELAQRVDVLIENFSVGTLDRLRLGAEALRALNPRLIYAQGSGFGRTGPLAHHRGMDPTIQAVSGIMSVNGEEGGGPLKVGAVICDFLSGVHLFGAIMLALYRREQNGAGAVLDVSMQETVFPTLSTMLGTYLLNGELPPRRGNRHANLERHPYYAYEAADGHVWIMCLSNEHWEALLRAMERSELIGDTRYADHADRIARMIEVDELVELWTRTLGRSEIVERVQKEGGLAAPVRNIAEVLEDAQMLERGALEPTNNPWVGSVNMGRTSLRFEGEALPELTPTPMLGEHNAQVYREFLGLQQPELDALKSEGVI